MSYADFKTMYLSNAVEEVKALRAKNAEEEAMRLAAEAEAQRKAEAEEAARQLQEEEARQAKEAERETPGDDIEDDDDDDGDEWLAAVEMAQQGMEGTIVGLDEAIQDDGVKATWDAAGALAQELGEGGAEEDDDEDEIELDMEALGQAARAAVEQFESDQLENVRSDADDEEEEEDEEDLDDFLPDGDLEQLAAAARQAVEAFGVDDYEEEEEEKAFEGIDGMVVASSNDSRSPPKQESFQRDWTSLTVAKLKDELRFRGLKAYGKKAELISMLEAYSLENDASSEGEDFEESGAAGDAKPSDDIDDDELFDLGDIDLEELGRQARAAVELGAMGVFDAEEPSDEVLMQLESEESILLDPSLSVEADDFGSAVDYAGMTVLELKDALRDRGLRLSGKKAELIQRLQTGNNS
jgi:hypothetical protein